MADTNNVFYFLSLKSLADRSSGCQDPFETSYDRVGNQTIDKSSKTRIFGEVGIHLSDMRSSSQHQRTSASDRLIHQDWNSGDQGHPSVTQSDPRLAIDGKSTDI